MRLLRSQRLSRKPSRRSPRKTTLHLACYVPDQFQAEVRITKVVKGRSPRLVTKVVPAVMAALEAQTVTVPAEATFGRVIAELATMGVFDIEIDVTGVPEEVAGLITAKLGQRA